MKKNWSTTHDMGEDLRFIDLSVSQERKDNLILYRFMSIERFKELLDDKFLFFAKAKNLSDKYEGGNFIPELEELCFNNREYTFVNCWTKNNPLNESSLLMWRPYFNVKRQIECECQIAIGVSINTFFLKTYSSYIFRDKIFEKYMGKIYYLTPGDEYLKKCQSNTFVPFFVKRDDYGDEDEIRIIIQDMKPNVPSRSFKRHQKLNGKEIPEIPVRIDLKKINEIFISPTTKCDVVYEITGWIKEKGLNKSIKKVPMPSEKVFKEAIKKVERLNELNKKQAEASENSKQPPIIDRNYGSLHQITVLSEEYTDASGNVVYGYRTLQNSQKD